MRVLSTLSPERERGIRRTRPRSLADASGSERRRRARRRGGFTLIELLIVIAIFLVISAATLAAVNGFRNGDRVSGAARQVQSFVSGARDRAIYTNRTDAGPRPRGVRFLLDPNLTADLDNDPATAPTPFACVTMQYVEGGGFFPPRSGVGRKLGSDFALFVAGDDPDPPGGPFVTEPAELFPGVVVPGRDRPEIYAVIDDGTGGGTAKDNILTPAERAAFAEATAWAGRPINRVFKAGLLGEMISPAPGSTANVRGQFRAKVRLPADRSGAGPWYACLIESGAGTGEQARRLAGIRRVRLLTDPTGGDTSTAQSINSLAEEFGPVFQLRTIPLAGEQPRALPEGTAIDLASAARLGGLPTAWVGPVGLVGPLEVMFDPAGLVTGDLAASGRVHLPVVSTDDLAAGANAAFNAGPAYFPPGTFLPLEYTGDGTDDPVYDTDAGVYRGPGRGEEALIVTVSTQTGTVSVAGVDPSDGILDLDGDGSADPPDGLADDPFFFAESGLESVQ